MNSNDRCVRLERYRTNDEWEYRCGDMLVDPDKACVGCRDKTIAKPRHPFQRWVCGGSGGGNDDWFVIPPGSFSCGGA